MTSEIERNPPSCVKKFCNVVEAVEMYRTLYRDITNNGVELQYNDRHALGELAVMMLEMQLLREQLYGDEGGESRTVQGDRNMVTKRNPARDSLEKLRTPVLRLMKEFKMTPGSRNVKAGRGGIGSEADDEFNNF